MKRKIDDSNKLIQIYNRDIDRTTQFNSKMEFNRILEERRKNAMLGTSQQRPSTASTSGSSGLNATPQRANSAILQPKGTASASASPRGGKDAAPTGAKTFIDVTAGSSYYERVAAAAPKGPPMTTASIEAAKLKQQLEAQRAMQQKQLQLKSNLRTGLYESQHQTVVKTSGSTNEASATTQPAFSRPASASAASSHHHRPLSASVVRTINSQPTGGPDESLRRPMRATPPPPQPPTRAHVEPPQDSKVRKDLEIATDESDSDEEGNDNHTNVTMTKVRDASLADAFSSPRKGTLQVSGQAPAVPASLMECLLPMPPAPIPVTTSTFRAPSGADAEGNVTALAVDETTNDKAASFSLPTDPELAVAFIEHMLSDLRSLGRHEGLNDPNTTTNIGSLRHLSPPRARGTTTNHHPMPSVIETEVEPSVSSIGHNASAATVKIYSSDSHIPSAIPRRSIAFSPLELPVDSTADPKSPFYFIVNHILRKEPPGSQQVGVFGKEERRDFHYFQFRRYDSADASSPSAPLNRKGQLVFDPYYLERIERPPSPTSDQMREDKAKWPAEVVAALEDPSMLIRRPEAQGEQLASTATATAAISSQQLQTVHEAHQALVFENELRRRTKAAMHDNHHGGHKIHRRFFTLSSRGLTSVDRKQQYEYKWPASQPDGRNSGPPPPGAPVASSSGRTGNTDLVVGGGGNDGSGTSPSAADVDFTNLHTWLREYNVFRRLHTIPFFKFSRLVKLFTFWRKAVLASNRYEAAIGLDRRLLLLDPEVRDLVLKVRRYSARLEFDAVQDSDSLAIAQKAATEKSKQKQYQRVTKVIATAASTLDGLKGSEGSAAAGVDTHQRKVSVSRSTLREAEPIVKLFNFIPNEFAESRERFDKEGGLAGMFLSALADKVEAESRSTSGRRGTLSPPPNANGQPRKSPPATVFGGAALSDDAFNPPAITKGPVAFADDLIAFHKHAVLPVLNEHRAKVLDCVDEGCQTLQRNLLANDPDLLMPGYSNFVLINKKKLAMERAVHLRRLCDYLFSHALVANAVQNTLAFCNIVNDSADLRFVPVSIHGVGDRRRSSVSPQRSGGSPTMPSPTSPTVAPSAATSKWTTAATAVIARRKSQQVAAPSNGIHFLSGQAITTGRGSPSRQNSLSPTRRGSNTEGKPNRYIIDPLIIVSISLLEGTTIDERTTKQAARERKQARSKTRVTTISIIGEDGDAATLTADDDSSDSSDASSSSAEGIFQDIASVKVRDGDITDSDIEEAEDEVVLGVDGKPLSEAAKSLHRLTKKAEAEERKAAAARSSRHLERAKSMSAMSRTNSMGPNASTRRPSAASDASGGVAAPAFLWRAPAAPQPLARHSSIVLSHEDAAITVQFDRIITSIMGVTSSVPSMFAETRMSQAVSPLPPPSPGRGRNPQVIDTNPHTSGQPVIDSASLKEAETIRLLIRTHPLVKPALGAMHKNLEANLDQLRSSSKGLTVWAERFDKLTKLSDHKIRKDGTTGDWFRDRIREIRSYMTEVESLNLHPRIGLILLDLTPLRDSLRKSLSETLHRLAVAIPLSAKRLNEGFLEEVRMAYGIMVKEPELGTYATNASERGALLFGMTEGIPPLEELKKRAAEAASASPARLGVKPSMLASSSQVTPTLSYYSSSHRSHRHPSHESSYTEASQKQIYWESFINPKCVGILAPSVHKFHAQYAFAVAIANHFAHCARISNDFDGFSNRFESVKDLYKVLQDEPELVEELNREKGGGLRRSVVVGMQIDEEAADAAATATGTGTLVQRMRERTAAFETKRDTRSREVGSQLALAVALMKQSCKEMAAVSSLTANKVSEVEESGPLVNEPSGTKKQTPSALLPDPVQLLVLTTPDPFRFQDAALVDDDEQLKAHVATLTAMNRHLSEVSAMEHQLMLLHQKFDMDYQRPDELKYAVAAVTAALRLWSVAEKWNTYVAEMRVSVIRQLPITVIADIEGFAAAVQQCSRTSSKCPAFKRLKQSVELVRSYVPVIEVLRCPYLKSEHWREINRIVESLLQSTFVESWMQSKQGAALVARRLRSTLTAPTAANLRNPTQGLSAVALANNLIASGSAIPNPNNKSFNTAASNIQSLLLNTSMSSGSASVVAATSVAHAASDPVAHELQRALAEQHFAVTMELLADTFQYLMDNNIVNVIEALQAVALAATQESLLDRELSDCQSIWQGGTVAHPSPVSLEVVSYKSQREVFVLGPSVDEVLVQLEESSIRVASLLANRFCQGLLLARATRLHTSVQTMAITLKTWIEFQRLWMFLEAVFGQSEMARQWPADEREFKFVDKEYKQHMRGARTISTVLHTCRKQHLVFFLNGVSSLERLQRSLIRRIDQKRIKFPRFYFLSDEDVLDVLAQVKTPEKIVPHLMGMFDNIKSLQFEYNGGAVSATNQHPGLSMQQSTAAFSTSVATPSRTARGAAFNSSASSANFNGSLAGGGGGGPASPASMSFSPTAIRSAAPVSRTVEVVGAVSSEGCVLALPKAIRARGDVEVWLERLETSVAEALENEVWLAFGVITMERSLSGAGGRRGRTAPGVAQSLLCAKLDDVVGMKDSGSDSTSASVNLAKTSIAASLTSSPSFGVGPMSPGSSTFPPNHSANAKDTQLLRSLISYRTSVASNGGLCFSPQVIQLVNWSYWCSSVETHLQSGGGSQATVASSALHPLQTVATNIQRSIEFLSNAVVGSHNGASVAAASSPSRGIVPLPIDLSIPTVRTLLGCLITQEVHFRDTTEQLMKGDHAVAGIEDFGWARVLKLQMETRQVAAATTTSGSSPSSALKFSSAANPQVPAAETKVALTCKQLDCTIPYGYEYSGSQSRLVITPITDLVYLTITVALRMGLGAAPAGPAGTGKTETVKDLARSVAKRCIVFNCSEGVTFRMSERLFLGLIQSGSWACLDEFNRINIEVLSAIASQLMEMKRGRELQAPVVSFQGRDNVRMNPEFGVFITMNPGYAGRTELPDNLKSLFRPVAVTAPDAKLIAEVSLFSKGFTSARLLAARMTSLMTLCSEQLSPCTHYDFGMRAMTSILSVSGTLMVRSLTARSTAARNASLSIGGAMANSTSQQLKPTPPPTPPPMKTTPGSASVSTSEPLAATNPPNLQAAQLASSPAATSGSLSASQEQAILVEALNLCTLPKLLLSDVELYKGLVGDLFTVPKTHEVVASALSPHHHPPVGADTPEAALSEHIRQAFYSKAALQRALSERLPAFDEKYLPSNMPASSPPPSLANTPLVAHAQQMQKVVQLYQTLSLRFGVMIIGPAGSGKSVIQNVLANCYKLPQQVANKLLVGSVSPPLMAVSLGEAYGFGSGESTLFPQHSTSIPFFAASVNAATGAFSGRSFEVGGSGPTSFAQPPSFAIDRYHRINPKALTYAHLFGHLNHASNLWTDGVLVSLCKQILKEEEDKHAKAQEDATRGLAEVTVGSTSVAFRGTAVVGSFATPVATPSAPPSLIPLASVPERLSTASASHPGHTTTAPNSAYWVVFDGPVDTIWVESLNSVLDDSRLLCLDNGVRYKLPDPQMRMLFEVQDLQYASPATVSRCGMVCLNPPDTAIDASLRVWLSKVAIIFGPHVEAYVRSATEKIFIKIFQSTDEAFSRMAAQGAEEANLDEKNSSSPISSVNFFSRYRRLSVLPSVPPHRIFESFVAIMDALMVSEQGGWDRQDLENISNLMSPQEAAMAAARAQVKGRRATATTTSSPKQSTKGQARKPSSSAAAASSLPWTCMIDVLVTYATVWSVGSDLSHDEVLMFDQLVRQVTDGITNDSMSLAAALQQKQQGTHLALSVTANSKGSTSTTQAPTAVDTSSTYLLHAGAAATFPPQGSVFDYVPPPYAHGRAGWATWDAQVPQYQMVGKYNGSALSKYRLANPDESSSACPSFLDILVPTKDTVRLSSFIRMMIRNGQQVVVCGDAGVGKSILVREVLSNLETSEKMFPMSIQFAASTQAKRLTSLLESRLHPIHNKKQLLGSPLASTSSNYASRIVLVVDDANLPVNDIFGASPLQELLRQVVEAKGFYDTQGLFFKQIQNISTILCCGSVSSASGGASAPSSLNPRLLRHFVVARVPEQSDITLRKIFTILMEGHFGAPPPPSHMVGAKLTNSQLQAASMELQLITSGAIFAPEVRLSVKFAVAAAVELFMTVKHMFRPTAEAPHYSFALRDLTRFLQGVARATPKTVPTAKFLAHLWLNEAQRTFGDRLVSDAERASFMEEADGIMQRNKLNYLVPMPQSAQTAAAQSGSPSRQHARYTEDFEVGIGGHGTEEVIPTDEGGASKRARGLASAQKIPAVFWSSLRGAQAQGSRAPQSAAAEAEGAADDKAPHQDLANKGPAPDTLSQAPYERMATSAELVDSVTLALEAASAASNSPAMLDPSTAVLFPYCCAMIVRVSRILGEHKGGSALLLGEPGCGKRFVARLAAYVSGYKCIEALPTAKQSFTDIAAKAFLSAGEGAQTVLLISDADVTASDESIFEEASCILNGLEIPNMFAQEQLDGIYVRFVERLQQHNRLASKRSLAEAKVLEEEAQAAEEAEMGNNLVFDTESSPLSPSAGANGRGISFSAGSSNNTAASADPFLPEAGIMPNIATYVINFTDKDKNIVDDEASPLALDISKREGSGSKKESDATKKRSAKEKEKEAHAVAAAAEDDALNASVPSKDTVHQFFLSQVKSRLHIVLCLSTDGQTGPASLHKRFQRYPALISCATPIWFHSWPKAALVAMAAHTIAPLLAADARLEQQQSSLKDMTNTDPQGATPQVTPLLDASQQRRGSHLTAAAATPQHQSMLVALKHPTPPLKNAPNTEDPPALMDSLSKALSDSCADAHEVATAIANTCAMEAKQGLVITTAGKYVQFVRAFASMTSSRRQELTARQEKFATGVERMKGAMATVTAMEAEVRLVEPLIAEEAENIIRLTERVREESVVAQQVADEVEVKKMQAYDQEQVSKQLEAESQNELAKALPEFNKAKAALGSLEKPALDEMKNYRQPPKAVQTTMEAVLVLMGETQISWAAAKAKLGIYGFKESLLAIEISQIDAGRIARIQKYVKDPTFIPEIVGVNGSEACRSLCVWVRAVEHYYHVEKRIAPKIALVNEATKQLAAARAALEEAKEEQRAALRKCAELQDSLLNAQKKKKGLEEGRAILARRLEAAALLTSSLTTEKASWAKSVAEAKEGYRLSLREMLMCSAMVVYGGPMPHEYRKILRSAIANVMLINGVFTLISSPSDVLPMPQQPTPIAANAAGVLNPQQPASVNYHRNHRGSISLRASGNSGNPVATLLNLINTNNVSSDSPAPASPLHLNMAATLLGASQAPGNNPTAVSFSNQRGRETSFSMALPPTPMTLELAAGVRANHKHHQQSSPPSPQSNPVSTGIPLSSYSLEAGFSPSEVRDWHLAGLPRDPFSIDGACMVRHIITHGSRWPMLVDPQRQMQRWLETATEFSRIKALGNEEELDGEEDEEEENDDQEEAPTAPVDTVEVNYSQLQSGGGARRASNDDSESAAAEALLSGTANSNPILNSTAHSRRVSIMVDSNTVDPPHATATPRTHSRQEGAILAEMADVIIQPDQIALNNGEHVVAAITPPTGRRTSLLQPPPPLSFSALGLTSPTGGGGLHNSGDGYVAKPPFARPGSSMSGASAPISASAAATSVGSRAHRVQSTVVGLGRARSPSVTIARQASIANSTGQPSAVQGQASMRRRSRADSGTGGSSLKCSSQQEISQPTKVSEVVSAAVHHPKLLQLLRQAIPQGKTLILHSIEGSSSASQIPSSINNLLERRVRVSSGRTTMQLGDELEVHPQFQLILVSTTPRPFFPSNILNRVAVVNSLITADGLLSQVLGDVVKVTEAQLERTQGRLIRKVAEYRRSVKDTEDRILSLLSQSSGNILDNNALISQLHNSKTLNDATLEKVRKVEKKTAQLEVARMAYRPIAEAVSTVYFASQSLSTVNNLYLYSLEYVLHTLCLPVVQNSMPEIEPEEDEIVHLDRELGSSGDENISRRRSPSTYALSYSAASPATSVRRPSKLLAVGGMVTLTATAASPLLPQDAATEEGGSGNQGYKRRLAPQLQRPTISVAASPGTSNLSAGFSRSVVGRRGTLNITTPQLAASLMSFGTADQTTPKKTRRRSLRKSGGRAALSAAALGATDIILISEKVLAHAATCVRRGLFRKDRLLFDMVLSLKVACADNSYAAVASSQIGVQNTLPIPLSSFADIVESGSTARASYAAEAILATLTSFNVPKQGAQKRTTFVLSGVSNSLFSPSATYTIPEVLLSRYSASVGTVPAHTSVAKLGVMAAQQQQQQQKTKEAELLRSEGFCDAILASLGSESILTHYLVRRLAPGASNHNCLSPFIRNAVVVPAPAAGIEWTPQQELLFLIANAQVFKLLETLLTLVSTSFARNKAPPMAEAIDRLVFSPLTRTTTDVYEYVFGILQDAAEANTSYQAEDSDPLIVSRYAVRPPTADVAGRAQSLLKVQLLLLTRLLRPHTFVVEAEAFAEAHKQNISTRISADAPSALAEASDSAGARRPILVIVAAGADPISDLKLLHAETIPTENTQLVGGPQAGVTSQSPAPSSTFTTISLGQGQEQAALKAVVEAATTGQWVALMNAHLSQNTLLPLERLLAALKTLPIRDLGEEQEAATRLAEEAESAKRRQEAEEEVAAGLMMGSEDREMLEARLSSLQHTGGGSPIPILRSESPEPLNPEVLGNMLSPAAATLKNAVPSAFASSAPPVLRAETVPTLNRREQEELLRKQLELTNYPPDKVPTAVVADLLDPRRSLYRVIRGLAEDSDEEDEDEDGEDNASKSYFDRLRDQRRREAEKASGENSGDAAQRGKKDGRSKGKAKGDEKKKKAKEGGGLDALLQEEEANTAVAEEDFFDEAAFMISPEGSESDAAHVAKLAAIQQRKALAKLAESGQLGGTSIEEAISPTLLALANQYISKLPPALHPSFRLWIAVASNYAKMPQSILEGSEKVAFEGQQTQTKQATASAEEAKHLSEGTSVASGLSGAEAGSDAALASPAPFPGPLALFKPLLTEAMVLLYQALVERTARYGTGDWVDASVMGRATAGSSPDGTAAAVADQATGWGWNCMYSYSQADYQVATDLLLPALASAVQRGTHPSKCAAIAKFLVAKLAFGGRVTDPRDNILLGGIFDTFLAPVVEHIAKVATAGMRPSGSANLLALTSVFEATVLQEERAALVRRARAHPVLFALLLQLEPAESPVRALMSLVGSEAGLTLTAHSAPSASKAKASPLLDPTNAIFHGLHPSADLSKQAASSEAMLRYLGSSLRSGQTRSEVATHQKERSAKLAPVAGGIAHMAPIAVLGGTTNASYSNGDDQFGSMLGATNPTVVTSAEFFGHASITASQVFNATSAAPTATAAAAVMLPAGSASGGEMQHHLARSPAAASLPSASFHYPSTSELKWGQPAPLAAMVESATSSKAKTAALIINEWLPMVPSPILMMSTSEEKGYCEVLRVLLSLDKTGRPIQSSALQTVREKTHSGRSVHHTAAHQQPTATTEPLVFPRLIDRSDPLTTAMLMEISLYNAVVTLVRQHLLAAHAHLTEQRDTPTQGISSDKRKQMTSLTSSSSLSPAHAVLLSNELLLRQVPTLWAPAYNGAATEVSEADLPTVPHQQSSSDEHVLDEGSLLQETLETSAGGTSSGRITVRFHRSAFPSAQGPHLVEYLQELANRVAFMRGWYQRHVAVFEGRMAVIKLVFMESEGEPTTPTEKAPQTFETKRDKVIALMAAEGPTSAFISARHPYQFDISAFASPHSLLTALRQVFARFYAKSETVTVDQINFNCKVATEGESFNGLASPGGDEPFAPVICGIWAAGFEWDADAKKCKLLNTSSDQGDSETKPLVVPFPPISFTPEISSDTNRSATGLQVSIPAYKASYRAGERNYVTELLMPVVAPADADRQTVLAQWTRARTAFLVTRQANTI